MIFFYIRHGDPCYNPDSLTPLGKRQAEAVGRRLALYGVDKVFSSTSKRAIETAQPTCELLKKEAMLLDFCHEDYAARSFGIMRDEMRRWLFQDDESRLQFASDEIRALGYNWYKHPDLKKYKNGIERVYNESDKFFADLGYEHIRYTGKYKISRTNDERIALFAHEGFGMAFLSTILDIPYPMFCNHFDIRLSGITVIDFEAVDGFAIPKLLTFSNDSHLYKEGLPTDRKIRF